MNRLYDNLLYQTDLGNLSLHTNYPLLKGKSIAITGATGLLGSLMIDALCFFNEEFNAQIKIYALGRDVSKLEDRFAHAKESGLIDFVKYDLDKPYPDIVTDYIIHCAGNSHPDKFHRDPIGTLMGNVNGTNEVLKNSIKHGSRVLLLSSGEIYGDNTSSSVPMTEDYCGMVDLSNYRACYPEGKRAVEALAQSYIHQENADVVIARPCRIFGPTMTASDNKASAQFIRKGLANENIVLKSDGTQKFSYIYGADAVSALFKILLTGKSGEAYNVASEKGQIQLRDFAECVAKKTGRPVIYDTAGEPGGSKVTNALLDNGKLKKLGWKSLYDIADAIDRTLKILKEI